MRRIITEDSGTFNDQEKVYYLYLHYNFFILSIINTPRAFFYILLSPPIFLPIYTLHILFFPITILASNLAYYSIIVIQSSFSLSLSLKLSLFLSLLLCLSIFLYPFSLFFFSFSLPPFSLYPFS